MIAKRLGIVIRLTKCFHVDDAARWTPYRRAKGEVARHSPSRRNEFGVLEEFQEGCKAWRIPWPEVLFDVPIL